MIPVHFTRTAVAVSLLSLAGTGALAQKVEQVVKPPKTIVWMDVSTGNMAGMPDFDIGEMGGGLVGGLLGAFGKGNPDAKTTTKTYYGAARAFGMSRVVDVALWNSLKPGVEAAQRIPAGMKMGDKLPLLPLIPAKVSEGSGGVTDPDYKKPRGRFLFYWGCSATVRPGQPRIVDIAKMMSDPTHSDMGAFNGRFAPDRGAKVREGYDVFPNERDYRNLPRGASLVGEHQVMGDMVPESLKFTLGPSQDVMPNIELQSQGGVSESIALNWAQVPYAKAYFLAAMGMIGEDMIFWASSDVPDTGFGLFDFLSNGTIDKWIKDKVILGPNITQCAVPKGIFAPKESPATGKDREGGGASMLRMVAYGGEHGFVHPPRPTDPKVPWDQEWSVRLRLKTQTMAMLGMDLTASERGSRKDAMRNPGKASQEEAMKEEPSKDASENSAPANAALPAAVNLLKGLFGR
jgi:hypothetical protein